jgi:hypothetical protein
MNGLNAHLMQARTADIARTAEQRRRTGRLRRALRAS